MKKVAIVTGASGNLGKSVCQKLNREGFTVIALVSAGRKSSFEGIGTLEAIEVDLKSAAACDTTIGAIMQSHGGIDVICFLAGAFCTGTLETTDRLQLANMLEANFETAYLLTQAAFAKMQEQRRGKLIYIGARAAVNPREGSGAVAYALSKSLILGLADIVNCAGNNSGITATVIIPGVMDSPANRQSDPSADYTKWVQPAEVADAIAFLASDQARKLRNRIITIDGTE